MTELEYDLDERPSKRRKTYRCLDRMCGATDCWNCFPSQPVSDDDESEGDVDEHAGE